MLYSDIAKAIKALNVPSGVTKRFNCVSCGGYNTLGVTNRNGNLTWHCFRASCGTKGKVATTVTIGDLRRINAKSDTAKFTLPERLAYVSNSEALEWLRKFNCTKAIAKGLVQVRYDPKEHRIVFLVEDKGDIVDAAGRALGKTKPKWKRYGNSGLPLVVGNGTSGICFIVEDAASACAMSCLGDGIALLGTHLPPATLLNLKNYNKCVIALDPDAKLKTLSLARLTSQIVSTKVAFLSDDPKCFTEAQLRKQLGSILDETESNTDTGNGS